MAVHTSFGGATGAVGSTSGAAAGGLQFHAGVQNMASSGFHNMDNDSVISKSENRNQFKMGANDDTLSGLVGLDNNNVGSGAGANNDTKMSDNEAFMAYMSKAEAGDDDDDEDL